MNLTTPEIKSLINSRSDKEWNSAVERIKESRNDRLPDDWKPMLRQNKVMAIAALNWTSSLIPTRTNIVGLKAIAQEISGHRKIPLEEIDETSDDYRESETRAIINAGTVLASEEMKLDATTLPELIYSILKALDTLGIQNMLSQYSTEAMIRHILRVLGYLEVKFKDKAERERIFYTLVILHTFAHMTYPYDNAPVQKSLDRVFVLIETTVGLNTTLKQKVTSDDKLEEDSQDLKNLATELALTMGL